MVGNMTNYDAIKNMSLEQMAVTMYLLVAPFMEAMGEATPDAKAKVAADIRTMLQSEVKK
jgi:hypothetical protein